MFGLPGDSSLPKVWGAFVSTAMSAQLRPGWSQAEFEETVTRRSKRNGKWKTNRLWDQLRELSRNPEKELDKAWKQAESNLRDETLRTLKDINEEAVQWAGEWSDRLDRSEDDLDDASVAVMRFVINQTEKRRYGEVACALDEIVIQTTLTQSTVGRRLKRLTERGFLIKHASGWHRPPYDEKTGRWRGGSGRAAIYSLASPCLESQTSETHKDAPR